MTQSPSFSDFRHLMDLADNLTIGEADIAAKVRMILDGHHLIMFFVKDGVVYGCPEESRLTFARIKNPTKEDTGIAHAKFIAINLYDALIGKVTENLFSKKDMKSMKIIKQEKCAALLEKKFKSNSKTINPANMDGIEIDQENDRRPLRQED